MEKEKIAHSLKILLVEDNKSDAMMIQEMLYEAAGEKEKIFTMN